MSAPYRLVQWNRHKVVYDLVLTAFIVAFLAVFMGVSMATHAPPNEISFPILLMRALAVLGIVLLHVILVVGPLSRFTDLAAPLLYNRRHLGVAFFLVALLHSLIAIGFYGGFGVRNPVTGVLAGYTGFASISGFPFEVIGFAALVIFFVMAATSHDFWLKNLSPRVWKSLHTLVYFAYALVVLHVALGALQSEFSPLYAGLLLAGVLLVGGLHIAAGLRETNRDAQGAGDDEWVDACALDDIAEGEARTVCLRSGKRIALVRYDGRLAAMANECAHQGGPLGEGRIVGGCLTCPWHGYQYNPMTGESPPPYTEKIPTYELRIEGGRVHVNTTPRAPGDPPDARLVPKNEGDGS